MDAMSITEILRLHLAAAGAFRSEKLILWLYQQRGGYRLSDDPGLAFRMEEPQILEALTTKTVFELSVHEKLKILHCLMHQILSFASVRDVIDERFVELGEARLELRGHQIAENKRQKALEEAEKQKRKEMRMQKKEGELKVQENKKDDGGKAASKKEDILPDAHLTERQRLAIQAQKEKEEKKRQKEEDLKREEVHEEERRILERIGDLQKACGIVFLGRDRAYRRFWALETLPGLFVEHDDDTVGPCLDQPTPLDPNAGPMDEETAMKKVAQILEARNQASPDEKSSSDKENDQTEEPKMADVTKTYSKKNPPTTPVLKQKILSAKNGALDVEGSSSTSGSETVQGTSGAETKIEVKEESQTSTEHKLTSPATSLPWGACVADQVNCPVHSTILPRTHWAYYSTAEELDQLIDALSSRGFRERELRDKLQNERDRLAKNFRKFVSLEIKERLSSDYAKVKDEDSSPSDHSSIASSADLQLRDQILELEEKLYIGTLGTLKVRDRTIWQKAIQDGDYDQQCDSLAWGGKSVQDTPFESRLQSAGTSRDQVRVLNGYNVVKYDTYVHIMPCFAESNRVS